MTRSSKNLLLLALTFGASLTSGLDVQAGCHGRSGGYSSSSHGHSHSGSYHRPIVHAQPVYSRPSYSQPVYSEPVYQPPVYQQPVYQQPVYSQTQPVYVQPTSSYPQHQSVPQHHSVSHSGSPFGVNVQQGSGGFGVPQSTPQQQFGISQTQTPVQQPGGNTNNFGNLTEVPVQNQAVAPATNNPPVSAPVDTNVVNDAQLSALQALGGFAPPEGADVAAAQGNQVQPPVQNPLVGSWTANLSNGSRVQLSLQADGNFSWTAINQAGNASTFQGNYAVGNGTMTLSRSTDNQKLAGSMTMTSAGSFSFKLSDAQAASLEFTRS